MHQKFLKILLSGLLSLLFTGLLFVDSSGGDSAGCVEAKIWMDKHEFLPYEPIFINYEIQNITGAILLTNYEFFKQDFQIRDQAGNGYNNILHVDGIAGDTIQPGQTFASGEYIEFRYRTFNIGEYECCLNILGCDFNPPCASGGRSNMIKFFVKQPEGNDLLAYQAYKKLNILESKRDPDVDKKTWMKDRFLGLLEIAEKYPNSIYAPISLYAALRMESAPDDKKVLISIGHKLVEAYPDYAYSFTAFMPLIKAYKLCNDRDGALHYLNELIDKYPNSKISEGAVYWRGMMEKGNF